MYVTDIIVAALWQDVNKVLNQCQPGMEVLSRHESDLFERGLLKLEPAQDLTLIELEQTLLTLGSLKDLTKGIFYFLALPTEDGSVIVR